MMRRLSEEFYTHGGLNDLLVFVFIVSRAYLFINSAVYCYYDDLVRFNRISEIFRFNIDFKTLVRFFYNSNSILAVILILGVSVGIFSMLLFEYELFNIPTFYDTVWFGLITMTTVGYGDYFTKNLFGNFAAICATFMGAIAASLFTLVCFD